ncbi:MAG: hypothetical protein KA603_04885 [Azonexus sp.]|nr:hypothetical protein [Betaproteobacteria bacterium]MBP6035452.1 hypothetical protein [Azonexus sp.]MBP6906424.1 hypothetical protein [Azonexus sp.]
MIAESAPYTVALVPAKLTSQRVPNKNLQEVGGQALYVYSVRAGLHTPGIAETFVSSESQELLDSGASWGAHPILRPASLCDPLVSNQMVIAHALEYIEAARGRRPDLLVLLQPTHPFRCPGDIAGAMGLMAGDPDADSVFALRLDDELGGRLDGGQFVPEVPLPRRRRSEVPRYANTGSFYILRVSRTIAKGSFFGHRIRGFVLSRPEMEIDIDRPEQLAMARALAEFFRDDLRAYGLLDAERS